MNDYEVYLTRVYKITMSAHTEDSAMRCTEFFIGDSLDISNIRERKEFNFNIERIEMMVNEANEAQKHV